MMIPETLAGDGEGVHTLARAFALIVHSSAQVRRFRDAVLFELHAIVVLPPKWLESARLFPVTP